MKTEVLCKYAADVLINTAISGIRVFSATRPHWFVRGRGQCERRETGARCQRVATVTAPQRQLVSKPRALTTDGCGPKRAAELPTVANVLSSGRLCRPTRYLVKSEPSEGNINVVRAPRGRINENYAPLRLATVAPRADYVYITHDCTVAYFVEGDSRRTAYQCSKIILVNVIDMYEHPKVLNFEPKLGRIY